MSVILRNCCPPLAQVAQLGGLATQVYGLLWESAYKDVRRDQSLHKPWAERRDCGGTTTWTAKGIAGELGSCRKRVGTALNQLLDAGFIIAESYMQGGRGTKTTIWRVVHPDQLDARRAVIEILGQAPSETRQQVLTRKSIAVEPDFEFEEFLRQDYIENFGVDPYSAFDEHLDEEHIGDTNLAKE